MAIRDRWSECSADADQQPLHRRQSPLGIDSGLHGILSTLAPSLARELSDSQQGSPVVGHPPRLLCQDRGKNRPWELAQVSGPRRQQPAQRSEFRALTVFQMLFDILDQCLVEMDDYRSLLLRT